MAGATAVISLENAEYYVNSQLKEAIRKGAMRGLYSAALRMVQEITVRTIPQLVPMPVSRGIYKAGWRAEKTDDGAMYFNTAPYASIIEYGARASNVKVGRALIDALTEWVKIKGFAQGKAAKRMAWAIAINMAANYQVKGQVRPGGARGIFKGTGLRVMRKANEQLPKYIEEEVAREVEAALAKGDV